MRKTASASETTAAPPLPAGGLQLPLPLQAAIQDHLEGNGDLSDELITNLHQWQLDKLYDALFTRRHSLDSVAAFIEWMDSPMVNPPEIPRPFSFQACCIVCAEGIDPRRIRDAIYDQAWERIEEVREHVASKQRVVA